MSSTTSSASTADSETSGPPPPITTTSTYNSTSSDKHADRPPWILHHILDFNLPHELPLRIMFSFNSDQRVPCVRDINEYWANPDGKGRLLINFFSSLGKITPSNHDTCSSNLRKPTCGPQEAFTTENHPDDRFMDPGNKALFDIDFVDLYGRDCRRGLPLSVIRQLCDQAFAPNYRDANFNHALTAMDYLRDLELTRRSSLRKATERLEISKENWRSVLSADPDAYTWVKATEENELKIERIYAALFFDMRIWLTRLKWTMIHELAEPYFYKPYILAMLNTLFPPSVGELPSHRISPEAIYWFRGAFFQCIIDVESQGPEALERFVEGMLSHNPRHRYSAVRENIEFYTTMAQGMIEQANAIEGIISFRERQKSPFDQPPDSNLSSLVSAETFEERFPDYKNYHMIGKALREKGVSHPTGDDSPQERLRSFSFFSQTSGSTISIPQSTTTLLRPRAVSRPVDFATPNSEVAQNEVFTLPTTPCVQPPALRHHIHHDSTPRPSGGPKPNRRSAQRFSGETPSFRSEKSSSPVENGRNSNQNFENKLPSDNFAFLNKPYEPGNTLEPKLKKKASIGNFFLRKQSTNESVRGSPDSEFEAKTVKKAKSFGSGLRDNFQGKKKHRKQNSASTFGQNSFGRVNSSEFLTPFPSFDESPVTPIFRKPNRSPSSSINSQTSSHKMSSVSSTNNHFHDSDPPRRISSARSPLAQLNSARFPSRHKSPGTNGGFELPKSQPHTPGLSGDNTLPAPSAIKRQPQFKSPLQEGPPLFSGSTPTPQPLREQDPSKPPSLKKQATFELSGDHFDLPETTSTTTASEWSTPSRSFDSSHPPSPRKTTTIDDIIGSPTSSIGKTCNPFSPRRHPQNRYQSTRLPMACPLPKQWRENVHPRACAEYIAPPLEFPGKFGFPLRTTAEGKGEGKVKLSKRIPSVLQGEHFRPTPIYRSGDERNRPLMNLKPVEKEKVWERVKREKELEKEKKKEKVGKVNLNLGEEEEKQVRARLKKMGSYVSVFQVAREVQGSDEKEKSKNGDKKSMDDKASKSSTTTASNASTSRELVVQKRIVNDILTLTKKPKLQPKNPMTHDEEVLTLDGLPVIDLGHSDFIAVDTGDGFERVIIHDLRDPETEGGDAGYEKDWFDWEEKRDLDLDSGKDLEVEKEKEKERGMGLLRKIKSTPVLRRKPSKSWETALPGLDKDELAKIQAAYPTSKTQTQASKRGIRKEDISKPFLKNEPLLSLMDGALQLENEGQIKSREYTRRWLVEDERARRSVAGKVITLEGPKGRPQVFKRRHWEVKGVVVRGAEIEVPFEKPRAVPQTLIKPVGVRRKTSLFEVRDKGRMEKKGDDNKPKAVETSGKKYTMIDTSKYERKY